MSDLVSVTNADVYRLSQPTSEFRNWALYMITAKQLDSILDAVVRAGITSDRITALQYMSAYAKVHRITWRNITKSDIAGQNGYTRLVAQLERQHDADSNACSLRQQGVRSHEANSRLYAGMLPSFDQTQEYYGLESKKERVQLSMLEEDGPGQLFDTKQYANGHEYAQYILPNHSIDAELLIQLRVVLGNMVRIARKIKHVRPTTKQFEALKQYVPLLRNLLTPIFLDHVHKVGMVKDSDGQRREYYAILTLMTWAQAVLYIQETGALCLFREVPVVHPKYGFSGGRMDALVVSRINGLEPSPSQRARIYSIVYSKCRGVGKLIAILHQMFGSALELAVIDWKFAVGDGVGYTDVISPHDVNSAALAKHIEQVTSYLALCNAEYHLYRGNSGTPWTQEGVVITRAELHYLFPTRAPLIHTIEVDAMGQEQYFSQEVAARWATSRQQAIIRKDSSLMLGHIVRVSKGKEGKYETDTQATVASVEHGIQPLIGQYSPEHNPFLALIDQYRQCIDEDHALELVKIPSGSETITVLHLDRLIDIYPDIAHARHDAGMYRIHCPFPEHEDTQHSMHLCFGRGFFKCVGCGEYGFFVHTSMPEGIPYTSTDYARIRSRNAELLSVTIPDARHSVLKLAQDHLASSVAKGGVVATRLWRRYGIDHAHLVRAGVGFSHGNTIISHLLECGVSYEELIAHGFIAFSPEVNETMMRLLAYRGIKADRAKGIYVKGEVEYWGWPYCPLNGRITVPLGVMGVLSNIYGRYESPQETTTQYKSSFIHRSIHVPELELPYGMSLTSEMTSGVDEIIVTDSPLDMLIVMAMGYSHVISCSGNGARRAMQLVAAMTNSITFAFRPTKDGHKRYTQFCNALSKIGFTGTTRNLTAELLEQHPQLHHHSFKEWALVLSKNI